MNRISEATGDFLSVFNRNISAFNRRISSLNVSIFVERDYSFIKALTFTIFARFAKLRVERVSWKHKTFLETVAIKKVLELPPKESLSKLVSFESL